MFERFFQFDPEDSSDDSSSREPKSYERDCTPFASRRLRYESGHAMPAPMFIRLKDEPPRDR